MWTTSGHFSEQLGQAIVDPRNSESCCGLPGQITVVIAYSYYIRTRNLANLLKMGVGNLATAHEHTFSWSFLIALPPELAVLRHRKNRGFPGTIPCIGRACQRC